RIKSSTTRLPIGAIAEETERLRGTLADLIVVAPIPGIKRYTLIQIRALPELGLISVGRCLYQRLQPLRLRGESTHIKTVSMEPPADHLDLGRRCLDLGPVSLAKQTGPHEACQQADDDQNHDHLQQGESLLPAMDRMRANILQHMNSSCLRRQSHLHW